MHTLLQRAFCIYLIVFLTIIRYTTFHSFWWVFETFTYIIIYYTNTHYILKIFKFISSCCQFIRQTHSDHTFLLELYKNNTRI